MVGFAAQIAPVNAARYDKLLQSHTKDELTRLKLVRTSPDFRVIALGLPVCCATPTTTNVDVLE
jgi:hypothetical protein